MFKKENRLVPGAKFNNSYKLTVPQFVLKVKKNGLGLNRFGIVVSKRVDRRAVVRNKIKRIFRNLLVGYNRDMDVGNDMLFIVRPDIIGKTKKETDFSIKESLIKAGCFKK